MKLGFAAVAGVLIAAASVGAAPGEAVAETIGTHSARGGASVDSRAAARRPASRRCGPRRRSACRLGARFRSGSFRSRSSAASDRLLGARPPVRREAPPTPLPGAGPVLPGASPPPALPDYVTVTATEFRLVLSRPLVGRGHVTVELRNSGEDPHDLVVTPEGGGAPVLAFPETAPAVYTARAAELTAGRYDLFCSLPGHAAAGMSATLRVE